jgi:hypothetical protein
MLSYYSAGSAMSHTRLVFSIRLVKKITIAYDPSHIRKPMYFSSAFQSLHPHHSKTFEKSGFPKFITTAQASHA